MCRQRAGDKRRRLVKQGMISLLTKLAREVSFDVTQLHT